jgi:flagellar hook-associated protein 2
MGSSPITASTLDLSGASFGLGQGLNVQTVVQSLTTAAQAGEDVYTDEQTLYNSQISALQNITSLMTTLQTATQALQDPAGALAARDANSSNSSVVTATADSGIPTGNYSLVVNNLASTSTYASLPQQSANATLNAGTMQFTVGGQTETINVSSGNNNNTLSSLASYITNGNYGVTANVITDAQGAILTLTSNTSGASGEISNMSDNLGLGLGLTNSAVSSLQSSSTASVSNGTISYSVGGNNYQINVNSSNSNNNLSSLASYINTNSANLGGVTANVVTNAQGSYLALSSSSGAISNVSDSTGLGMSSYDAEAVTGQNASFSVNGVNVQTASNTVTGVIPGVTLSLQSASSSPVTLSVTEDVDQAGTAIENFVSAYNAVAQALNTQFTYTSGASSQPPLFSDSSLQQVQSTLATDINYFMSGNSGINSLSSVGVDLQQDGTLSVNTTTLASALSSNPSAVQNFFQGANYTGGFAGQLYNDVNNLNDPVSGVITVDENGINQELTDVTNTISEFNTNLQQQEQQWTTEYSQVNATLEQLPSLIQQAGGQVSSSSSSS